MRSKTTKRVTRTQPQMDWTQIDRLIWNLVSTWDGLSKDKKESIVSGVKEQFMWTRSQAETACQMHFNTILRQKGLPEIPYDFIEREKKRNKEEYLRRQKEQQPQKPTKKTRRVTKKVEVDTITKPTVSPPKTTKTTPKSISKVTDKVTTKSSVKPKSKPKTTPKKPVSKKIVYSGNTLDSFFT